MFSQKVPSEGKSTAAVEVTRLGVVSFLNTLPIIHGLESREDLILHRAVPSQLLDHVVSGQVDVGMCSSIDYLRSPDPLKILKVAPLTCNGRTLTVRVFSTRPLEDVKHVYCDTDSHTSVALLRILLRDHWGVDPELVEFDTHAQHETWPETVMLIGDKVVQNAPSSTTHPCQADLGQIWKDLTGLPFVFALWMARTDTCDQLLAHVMDTLAGSLAGNLHNLDELIRHHATAHGWPESLASEYLNGLIKYQLGVRELEGLQAFHDKAVSHGLAARARPLDIFEG